jgi:hypothetical protein
VELMETLNKGTLKLLYGTIASFIGSGINGNCLDLYLTHKASLSLLL